MNSEIIIAYLSISGLLIAAAYVVYRLLLADAKMPGFNRGVIMAVYAASLLAPLAIVFSNKTETDEVLYEEQTEIVVTANLPEADIPVANEYAGTTILADDPDYTHHPSNRQTKISDIMLLAGIVGVMLAAARFFWGVASTIKLCLNGQQRRYGRLRLVITDNNRLAPFSWLNTIVISRDDLSCDGIMILEHEFSHIRNLHFIDLTVSRIFCIMMWWNPAVWLLNKELRAVHEYQADAGVLSRGRRATEYQMLLITKATGTRMPAVVSGLSHGKLKTRFLMMRRKEAGLGTRLRAAAIIPAITIATMTAGLTEAGNKLREIAADESVYETPDFRIHAAGSLEILSDVENNQSGMIAGESVDDRLDTEHDKNAEATENADSGETETPQAVTDIPDNNDAEVIDLDISDDIDYSDEVQWAEIISTEVISGGNINDEIESRQRDYYDELLKESQQKMAEARRQQQENIKAQQQEIKRQQQEVKRHQQEVRRHQENIKAHQQEVKRHQQEIMRQHQENIKAHQQEEIKRQQEAVKRQQEAVKRQQEAVKRQQEAVKRQQEAAKRQQEAVKRQQEAIRRQTRDIRVNKTSDYATEAEDQNVKGMFASLDNCGGSTNIKVWITSEKPVTTVGSAMVMINGRRYPTKIKNVIESERQNNRYVTEVYLATSELHTFSRNDYVTLITDQGTTKIDISYK